MIQKVTKKTQQQWGKKVNIFRRNLIILRSHLYLLSLQLPLQLSLKSHLISLNFLSYKFVKDLVFPFWLPCLAETIHRAPMISSNQCSEVSRPHFFSTSAAFDITFLAILICLCYNDFSFSSTLIFWGFLYFLTAMCLCGIYSDLTLSVSFLYTFCEWSHTKHTNVITTSTVKNLKGWPSYLASHYGYLLIINFSLDADRCKQILIFAIKIKPVSYCGS